MISEDDKREFYQTCANILDIPHEYHIPVPRRTRWNNRILGNGRYPGFGLIHCFGNKVRVISKQGTRMFDSFEQVYEYLAQLKNQ
jgi:hypothetical protein